MNFPLHFLISAKFVVYLKFLKRPYPGSAPEGKGDTSDNQKFFIDILVVAPAMVLSNVATKMKIA